MSQSEWIEIKNNEDIESLMKLYGGFHDGCIKEIRYISGMCVGENLSMNPINNKRDVYILFQRQFKDPSTIEMLFEKIDCLYLNPRSEQYDGIIYDAYMCFEDDKVVWFDDDYFEEEEEGYKAMYDNSNTTWIRADRVKYRIVECCLGDEEVYINKK
ncbi:MAG: hypothetical protein FWC68_02680 [Oscillospiraceae bacterium]|nr:hypothetical protein [Oscillospiraceae bacterium]